MTEREVPQELIDILDARAGRAHDRSGSAVRTLAEILTRYDEILARRLTRADVARLFDVPDHLLDGPPR